MADNELSTAMRMEIGQVLAKLDQIEQKVNRVGGSFKKAETSSASLGTAIAKGATASVAALTSVLTIAQQVAQAVQEVDNRMADLARTSGRSRTELNSTLLGLGVKDPGKVARNIRNAQGLAAQGEIDSFVGTLDQGLSDQQVSSLAGTYARGGSQLFGRGEVLGGLSEQFGDLKAADVGDLAIEYRRSAGRDLKDANLKQLNQLTGSGVDRYQALAVLAAFNERGQGKGVDALVGGLQSGYGLDDLLAGKADNPALSKALVGVGAEGLGAIGGIADRFRSIDRRDVIGEEIDRLESDPATARENAYLRRRRNREVRRLGAGETASALEARERGEIVDDTQADFDQDSAAQGLLFRMFRQTYGDRAASARAGATVDLDDRTVEKLGAVLGRKVQSREASQ